MKLLVATSNPGKIREILEILGSCGITLVSPDEKGIAFEVEESGTTFAENATIKALAWNRATGMPSLADDSGLCVDALGGAPGVFSARYAGHAATDADNNSLLLRNLEGVEDRTARFVCVMALAFSPEDILTTTGQCEGVILTEPRGEQGFGYDCLFLDPGSGKSFAQMTPEEKNARSHRRRALMALRDLLKSTGRI
ncbi:MAG: RdgB/HAM1 family non-canonical purine NTP pyrophosphatase, partial [Desulfomonilia bacterium]|nr:RdgB/HAM1 family non-canonical purine NTP pyrophosphatase [Desulfomonilia bacterium]